MSFMDNKINDKLKYFTAKFDNFFRSRKKFNIIFAIGIVGILLISLSEVDFSSKKTTESTNMDEISIESYIEKIENKTKKIIGQIDGAGKCEVMITAEISSEKDYATNDNIKQETENKDNENILKNDSEKEVVMIENSSGKKQALIQKIYEPKIRGVLVLCEGADNAEINEKITNAVRALLNVSSNKISVLKIKK